MEKFERRRLALKALVDSIGYGGIARVAEAIGKEPNYVSRMLYEPGKSGRKRIGESSIDALNAAFPGWLDSPPSMTLHEPGPSVFIEWPFQLVHLSRIKALPKELLAEVESDLLHSVERVEKRLGKNVDGDGKSVA